MKNQYVTDGRGQKTAKKLTPKQKKWVNDFKSSLTEVDLHLQCKIKLKSAKQFLDEL